MAKLWLGWIAVLLLLVAAASRVGAATLSFQPGAQTIGLGATASVDLVLSGLGDSGPPSLGTFDLVVSFDASILSLDSVAFGPELGDEGAGDVDQSATPAGVGGVNLVALSFLTPDELDSLQASDSLVLATLSFDTLAIGEGALGIGDVTLGDASGTSLPLDAVVPGSITVPEPAALWLAALALAAVRPRRANNGRK